MQYTKVKETTYRVTMTKNGKTHKATFDEWDKVIDEIQEYVDEKRENGWYFAGCEKVQIIEETELLWF